MSTPNVAESKNRSHFNQATLAGRVNAVRKADDSVFTEVTLPAPDQYSPPATVEIRSRKRLGQVGETIEVSVTCAGYRGKAFQYHDKETGERFTRRPVVNSYVAIED
ncbi:hypothetical protein HNQ59_001077 [Chitinivorax tropicus]|uniref:Single-stranded DNA-binding protein n=1 Tax=Chitinivorax tropicus TaxID=714531 RepID=A0A840MLN7_9PROT|nr:hypothetical protein [Chitinivorax tropicus]MBB5017807.1 hypothetical protein [Chitinivorax tropicus]